MKAPFPAYRGGEPYVFVCYSHEDSGLVYPDLVALRDSGANLYYDEGISPGHEWTEELARAIDGASQLVCFISARSVASRHCRNEIQYALDQDKQVIPVFLERTELPGGLKLSIGSAQAIMKDDLGETDYQRKLRAAVEISTRPAEVEVLTPNRSIAVLPFVNASNNPEQDFLSDGIAEDVLNTLAQSADLVVRPRSSSFAFRAAQTDSQLIGKQLHVAHVLEGSVRKAGDRLRISAQLVEVSTNRPIWSGRFDRRLTDIFEVQDEISAEILAALDVVLSSRRAPRQFTSEEAYEAFLRSRYAFSQYELRSAEDWLARAVELDPGNAEAWALRADVNAYQSAVDIVPNSGVHRDQRRRYVERALSIEPAHPNALAVRALMDTHYTERDYQTAINRLVGLASMHPNNDDVLIYLAFALATIGRASLVDRVTERLIRLFPRSPNSWLTRILYGHLLFGTVDRAKSDLVRFPNVRSMVGGEIALAERNPTVLMDFVPKGDVGGTYGAVYAMLVPYLQGDFDSARQLAGSLRQAGGYLSHRIKALASLAEQDIDGALAHYRDGILAAEQGALSMVQGPASWRLVFPEYFSDPRYMEMLKEFKLDPHTTSKIQVPELPF